MRLSHFTGGFCATNGYFIETPDGNLLIDAPEGVAAWLAARGARVDHLLLTHQHFDHVLDAAAIQATGARLTAHAARSPELTLEAAVADMGVRVPPYTIDRILAVKNGDILDLCGLSFRLHHVPGHSPDSVVYHLPEFETAFSGDTLFADSIGRTDLPGGSHELLLTGIRRELLTLPPATKLLPGHGPATTVAAEARGNPFLS